MSYGKTIKSLLLAVAILAPASILAVLGLRAYRAESLLLRERYRQDQEAIVRLVAGRLSEAARKALEDLEARVGAHEPDATLETRFRAAHPLARHIFFVRRGRLIYPSVTRAGHEPAPRRPGLAYLVSELDVNNYVSRIREQRRQGNRLIRGERAEFAGRLKAARRLFRRASRGTTDPSAQALLGLARVERRVGELEAARESYHALRRRFGGRQDREGISYALLADAGLAGMGEPQDRLPLLLEMHQRLLKGEYVSTEPARHFYLRWIVEQLGEVGKGSGRASQLRRVTSDLFASERFGTLLNLHGVTELQQLAGTRVGSVALDRRTVLVLRRRGGAVVGYTVDEDYLGRRVAMHQKEVVPADRGIQLTLRRVGEVARRPGRRLLFSSLLDPPLGHWTLATYAPRRDTVDPLEQRGALGRLGLVVGLILALLVGLVLTYRGVRRESELARLKSDFASNVSHELKTPLTSIRMYAEMLEEGIAGTPDDRRRYHRVIIRESERLGRLIANVLDFSRVERGTRRYELQPENLAEMTREAVETFRRLAEGERIRIEVAPNGDPLPPVTADREAAVQSILNLLSNAAKYSPGEPLIHVDLVGRDGEVGVEVRDRGIGIPPSEQKRIFDDFYRAPDSRRIGVEGTGLGLALVRRHMKACGGHVELESEQGKGSRFTLWFPRAPEERKDTQEAEHVENPDHRG